MGIAERNEPSVMAEALALWILPHVAKMPRDHQFTLGERSESSVLAILEHIVQASYKQRKEAGCGRRALAGQWRKCGEIGGPRRLAILSRYVQANDADPTSALSLPNGAMELRRSLLHGRSIAKEKAAFPLSLLPRECYSNIMACGFLTGGD